MHLRFLQEVAQTTLSLCNALESVEGISMGITEDMPMAYRQASCTTIMDNLDRHARGNPITYKELPLVRAYPKRLEQRNRL
jgi:hypothetical protein